MPCWILENWFTLDRGNNYFYSAQMTDQCRNEILDLLSGSSGYSRIDIYIVKSFVVHNNKIVTRNVVKELIKGCSFDQAGQPYSPVLVKNLWCIKGTTFKLTVDTKNLVIGCISPSVDSIFTKIIQDEERL